MKIELNKSEQITYFVELTQVNGGYQVKYLAEGSTQKMCPVNQQFCDNGNCNGCIHYDNGFKLQRMTKDEYDRFIEEHKDLN